MIPNYNIGLSKNYFRKYFTHKFSPGYFLDKAFERDNVKFRLRLKISLRRLQHRNRTLKGLFQLKLGWLKSQLVFKLKHRPFVLGKFLN